MGSVPDAGNAAKTLKMSLEIALYQPDIAPNAAAIARMCACFGLRLTIIEPSGFILSDSAFRRAGMDYLEKAVIQHSPGWEAFRASALGRRIVLLTTKASQPHLNFGFRYDDILLFGRESAGVPPDVHEALPDRIRIPMKPGLRSLNVAMSASLVTGEALRQTGQFAALV